MDMKDSYTAEMLAEGLPGKDITMNLIRGVCHVLELH
jgi:hypothetical protein